MRVAIVSRHLPEPEGSAAGRILAATRRGLVEAGAEVTVHSWGPDAPRGELPDGCRWTPLPSEPRVRSKARALVRPRADAALLRWRPPEDAVVVADDPLSYPALRATGYARSAVTTFHYLTAIDVRAVGERRVADVQDLRAERRVARRSAGVLAYSGRVGEVLRRWSGAPVEVVPAAIAIPEEPFATVDEPVAGLLADWRWAPNRWALDVLLRSWPEVRWRVPSARLVLGGRGDPGIGTLAGVRDVGTVARSEDLLSELAVLAFPCPPSSGPKVKVLEAFAAGLSVATTPAGVEGIDVGPGSSWTGGPEGFADLLADALSDPTGRADRGALARSGVARTHAPRPAAERRLAALRGLLGGA